MAFPLVGAGQIDTTAKALAPLILIVKPVPNAHKVQHYSLEDMVSQGRTNLAEVFQEVTPVFVKSYGPNGIATANFRGGRAEHTRVYVNGLDMTYASLGQTDLSLIPLGVANQMSLQFGQSGLSLGTGALGGTVSPSQRYALDTGWAIKTNYQYTSLSNSSVTASLERTGPKLSGKLFGGYREGMNRFKFVNPTLPSWPVDTMTHSAFLGWNAGGHLQWTLGKRHKVAAQGWWQQLDRQIPPTASQSRHSGEFQGDELGATSLSYQYRRDRLWLTGMTGYVSSVNRYNNPLIDLGNTNFAGMWQSMLTVEHWARIWRWNVNLSAQARYHLEQADSENFDQPLTARRWSGYASIKWNWSDYLRYFLAGRVETYDQQFSGVMPKVGFAYRFKRYMELVLKGSWSASTRYPTLNERFWSPGGNPDLLPENGHMSEVILEWGNLSKRVVDLRVNVAAYAHYANNWIVWLPGQSYWSPVNLKRVLSRGVEVEGMLSAVIDDFSFEIELKGSYNLATNLEVHGDDDLVGKQVLYAPNWQVLGKLDVQYHKWALGVSVPYTGRYFIARDNSAYMPAYGFGNVRLSRRFNWLKSDWSLGVECRNLGNWQYQVIPNRPMPGRYWGVNVGWKI